MEWVTLFSMQKQLDSYIEANHRLNKQDIFQEKCLALFVELGELANETRCFKFWSTKPASSQAIILEEYVDGLHFIMSLGIGLGYEYKNKVIQTEPSLTEQFLIVYQCIAAFQREPSQPRYNELFDQYVHLGKRLDFSEDELKQAYIKKNEINYKRQDQGY